MINTILTKIFGSQHERDVKKLLPLVAAINELEPQIKALSDDQLRGKTAELRQKLAQGATLDDLLVEAFAVAREAAWRTVHMRPFDVQLMGGIMLHRGRIAEMRTGEGKTLVATLPVYLNALEGKGVHVVTVNDYLARRDSDWMGRIYRFLGLSVGVIQHDMPDDDRKAAYGSDVTYGTNNEFGFDYLRDNMKFELESMVQRGHHYAIVDEVDSILIDEARTPLIISGPSEESIDKYYRIDRIIPKLVKGEEIDEGDGKKSTTGDYLVDEKGHSASLTDEGVEKVEKLLGVRNLYDPENMETLHGVNQALRAHALYQRDVDYLVKDGKVVIVDEFTGRMMPGRRWSDGLHQAVEAKEGVKIERENQTLATITFQNYFRMYKKLAGMTGTADTEASEFAQIYNLDVDGHPDQPGHDPRRPGGPGLPHRAREVGRRGRGDPRVPGEGPAGAGGHGVDREERDALEAAAQAARGQARGPERQVPRARGVDRRPGGPQGRGHHRHQHGRPRHRHRPRRQPRGPRPGRGGPGDRARGSTRRRSPAISRPAPASATRCSPPAACTSSAPSGTSRGASTTSSAAAPAARATPARRASICRSKTT